MANIWKTLKNVHYDRQSDVLYFAMQKGTEEEFIEISPGVSLELDQKGRPIGIEVLNASKIFKPVFKTMQQQVIEA